MGIKLELGLTEGWKANKNDRFGEALIIRFIDEATKKVMFEYAPKLDDKDFWGNAFNTLINYDEHLTVLRKIIDRIPEINKLNYTKGC